MNDHDPTPEQELASAYLDGEVTAVERARVEASPELRALVASMREVKSYLAAVPPVSDAVRDMAIASALSQFDAIESGSNVLSLDSRRRWPTRVMSAAAAVVLLGVVGITVMQNTSDDKSESAARDPESTFEASKAEDAVGAADTSGEQVLAATPSPLVIDDPQQLLLLPVPMPPTAEAPDSDGGADACMTDDQVFLADIIYQGAIAIAVRDRFTDVTEAIDSNCTVLASVSP